MSDETNKKRTDFASRVIMATPRTIYQAFLNADAMVSWLPPKGMTGHIYTFDSREGGAFRMVLTYDEMDQTTIGKTSENADVIQGKFLKLVPDERITQMVEFESEDLLRRLYDNDMDALPAGTKVTIVCENVPEGIRQEDHEEGLKSTLENLGTFTE